MLLEAGLVLQGTLRQLLQAGKARAAVRLCKKHVKPDHGHLLALEQLVRKACKLVAPPGPVADALQALLVDIDNDDTLVQRARHGGTQPGVIDDVVQPLQNLQVQHVGHVQQRKHQGDEGDGGAAPAPS